MRALPALIITCLATAPLGAETISFEQNWGPQGVSVVEDTDTSLILSYSTSAVLFDTVDINGKPMSAIAIPGGALLGSDEDAPNLPTIGRFFAVPVGASVQVDIQASRMHLIRGREIGPAPRIPDDSGYAPLVYVQDPAIYSTNAFFPASPVTVSEPTVIRGVDAHLIGITPFQYNPVTKELRVYSDLRVRIEFVGGNGLFGEDRLRSRLFDPILRTHLVNASRLRPVTPSASPRGKPKTKSTVGEAEYVILVPEHPDFVHWGNVLRDFRIRQGIDAKVYTLAYTGATAEEIESWIDNAVKTWATPPAAILLLGDCPGDRETTIPIAYWNETPSDNIYADVYGNDDLPDLLLGRITARDSAELETMVMKIIDYESNPPLDPGFYQTPILAMGWQLDRWYGICSEVVYHFFAKRLGKSSIREHAISGASPTPSTTWSTAANSSLVLGYFGGAGLDYIPPTPAHLTDMGGDAARINSDINGGSFFAFHRDHGAYIGWMFPYYKISDLTNLHNVELPFVFSINCASGAIDRPTECFAEAITRMQYGAVGVIAATANSFSFVNDTYMWGMMDSLWPEFDPGYGSPADGCSFRPCLASMSGHYYLQASNWPANGKQKAITHHLYIVHCDPLFTMCSEVPTPLGVAHDSTLPVGAGSFQITSDAGAAIGLTVESQGGDIEIIGTGVGTGSPQSIAIAPQTEPRVMTVTVTKPNHLRYSATVFIPGPGSFKTYGTGLAGSGALTPTLSGTGMPFHAQEITLSVTNGLGGTAGLLFVGTGAASLPCLGGTALVQPMNLCIPITLCCTPGAAGAGSFVVDSDVPFFGASLFMQAFLADPNAPAGVSMTNGLEMIVP